MASTSNDTKSNKFAGNKRPVSTFRDAVMQTGLNHADDDRHGSTAMRKGENNCLEFTDRGLDSKILAVSQIVRGGDSQSICDKILASDDTRLVSDLIILLFVTRNTRGGKGEKDLSFDIFLRVWTRYPDTAKQLLKLFPHYGYWKDLLLLSVKAKESQHEILEPLLGESIALMEAQLAKDVAAMNQYEEALRSANGVEAESLKKKGPAISLLAKWLPRENTYFDKKLKFVDRFTQRTVSTDSDPANAWKSKSKSTYRKTVSKLTAYLELPEVLLSAQRADEINFHKLASRATFKLGRALLNETKEGHPRSEDPKRIRLAELFVEHLTQHGAKGSQLMPHEIVKEIQGGRVSAMRAKVLDAQWKDMWKEVVDQVKAKAAEEGLEFDPTRMVPLSDVSGSMSGIPMEVSIAMGIGISEITHPAFRHMVLTFESKPSWHKLNADDSIVAKVESLGGARWGGSTDFEAAYDRILEVCIEHRLKKEDVPVLIVFSDMQFNQALGYNAKKSMHEVIVTKFARAAESLGWEDQDPTPIVYWNLRTTGGHPVEKNTEGAVLLSGFSPSLLKLVMNGEALKEEEVELVELDGTVRKEKIRVTPEQVLRIMLDDALYDPVRQVLGSSEEGALKEYEILQEEAKTKLSDDEFELL